eukprot:13600797-Ditylum_brightwellii.AAC.2
MGLSVVLWSYRTQRYCNLDEGMGADHSHMCRSGVMCCHLHSNRICGQHRVGNGMGNKIKHEYILMKRELMMLR